MKSDCPLDHSAENKHRYSPKNSDMALCFQLHDTLRTLYGASAAEDRRSFKNVLATMKSQIAAHESLHP